MKSPAIIRTVDEMRRFSSAAARDGCKTGLIPTMGAIHEGHLCVVQETSAHVDLCVASVFVNPLQFSAGEDYGSYKRDEEGDIDKLSAVGIDAVFLPSADEIYPPGFQTYVEVGELQNFLCGVSRPGHFKGVATVVVKLFNIVSPAVAGFGEKDFQQLAIIKKAVADLNLDIRIVAVPTVREPSGLAISSRNEYLSGREREKAVVIPRVLFRMKRLFESGARESAEILKDGGRFLTDEGIVEVDYLEICNPETLAPVEKASEGSLAAIAARVGKVRIIDSIRF